MRAQGELRAFTYGVWAGVVAVAVFLVVFSYAAGVRWQPVKVGAAAAPIAMKCQRRDDKISDCEMAYQ